LEEWSTLLITLVALLGLVFSYTPLSLVL